MTAVLGVMFPKSRVVYQQNMVKHHKYKGTNNPGGGGGGHFLIFYPFLQKYRTILPMSDPKGPPPPCCTLD